MREEDTVAHLGGDEFMVMLDALGKDPAMAATRAESVADIIRHAFQGYLFARPEPADALLKPVSQIHV